VTARRRRRRDPAKTLALYVTYGFLVCVFLGICATYGSGALGR
jgi:hypothetical protein